MKTKLMVLLASLAAVTLAYSESPKSDTEAFQGKWQGTEKDASPDGPCFLSISGKTMEYHGVDTNDWLKGTFTLTEDATPKHFIGVIKDCPDPDSNGKTVYAIYKLEKDTLTISGNAPGETNFPSTFDDAGARHFVFKRK